MRVARLVTCACLVGFLWCMAETNDHVVRFACGCFACLSVLALWLDERDYRIWWRARMADRRHP